MIVAVLASLYVACSVLIVLVVVQDRNRATRRRDVRDPSATHASEFVFRTQA